MIKYLNLKRTTEADKLCTALSYYEFIRSMKDMAVKCAHGTNHDNETECIYLRIEATPEYVDKLVNDILVLAKRTIGFIEFPSWDKTFMEIAHVISNRSKDPRTQVGAVIVKNNRIVSSGYNGLPEFCEDVDYPWNENVDDIFESKTNYIIHAEMNAILYANRRDIVGSVLYITKFPCSKCTQAIIQSGITEIITDDKTEPGNPVDYEISKRMLNSAKINYRYLF